MNVADEDEKEEDDEDEEECEIEEKMIDYDEMNDEEEMFLKEGVTDNEEDGDEEDNMNSLSLSSSMFSISSSLSLITSPFDDNGDDIDISDDLIGLNTVYMLLRYHTNQIGLLNGENNGVNDVLRKYELLQNNRCHICVHCVYNNGNT